MAHSYNFIILVLRGGGRKFNGDLKVILAYAEMEVSMGERACVKKDEMEQTEQTNINASNSSAVLQVKFQPIHLAELLDFSQCKR